MAGTMKMFCDTKNMERGNKKNSQRVVKMKKKKIGLCACTKLKYCRVLYLIFAKSIYKIAFSTKLKLIQRHDSQITGLTVENGILRVKIRQSKG